VLALRSRQQRNFLTTLLLSQGVPMLAHGDELGRTQHGNNNGYCQDNELTWLDWELDDERERLLEFTRRLVRLRRTHPVFRRRRFFAGRPDHGGESELQDIAWLTPAGTHMDDAAWANDEARSVAVFLNGSAIDESDARGGPIVDDSFLLLFNGHFEPVKFQLPGRDFGERWTAVLDTDGHVQPGRSLRARAKVTLEQRSAVLLTRPPEPARAPSDPAGTAVPRAGHHPVVRRS
jgi:glycogen operon protein